ECQPKPRSSQTAFCAEADSSLGQQSAPHPGPPRARRLPACIIIGVRKGGTRAALRFLALHPDVAAAEREAHFFDRFPDEADGTDEEALRPELYRLRMPLSLAGQLTAEKTPAYFHTPAALRKLVLVVRNPIDRLVSDYLQVKSNRRRRGRGHPPLERLLLLPANGPRSGRNQLNLRYRPLRRSLYDVHMSRFLARFPLEMFHIVDGDKLARRPYPEMRRLEAALGLAPRLRPDMFYYNATRGFYCIAGKSAGRKAGSSVGWGCLAESKGRRHPPLKPSTRRLLAGFLRPHASRFERLVGRQFHWRLTEQPPFSWNGLSFLDWKPDTRQSLSLLLSMNWIMSLTHSDTGFRAMLASARSCSTIFFCWAMDDIFGRTVEKGWRSWSHLYLELVRDSFCLASSVELDFPSICLTSSTVVALLSVAMTTVQEAAIS
uniref:Sulfotransfer_1 domain-containing protein n=1 Tax=Macrostomum lignano TaxID=282301 RepID=A0A1I8IZA9_9PLAT